MFDDLRANRNAFIVALVFAIGLIACARLLCGQERKMKDELLFFHATWCGPCEVIHPMVRQLANEVPIRDVDVDREPALARRYRIRQVPTLVRLENGKEHSRIVGQVSAERLRRFIHEKKARNEGSLVPGSFRRTAHRNDGWRSAPVK
jgi:thioredoxin 1